MENLSAWCEVHFLEWSFRIEQPFNFLVKSNKDKILKLKKALHGLKQEPRVWYNIIDSYFNQQGFRRSKSEPTLYIKTQGNSKTLIVSLYVDDLIYMGNNKEMIQEFKKDIMKTFKMINLGLMHYFLGIEILKKMKKYLSHKRNTPRASWKNSRWQDAKQLLLHLWLMRNYRRKMEKKKGHINIQKFNKKLTISNNNKTRYNVCNKSIIEVHAKSKLKIHFRAVKRILRYL